MTQDEWLQKARLDNAKRVNLAKGKYDQKAIELGLLIKQYPVTWRQAKDLALSTKQKPLEEKPVFEFACQLFIELGGERQPLESAAADVHFSSAPSKKGTVSK